MAYRVAIILPGINNNQLTNWWSTYYFEVPEGYKTIGLASLRSVLEEDAKFPASKSELIEKQGWKVFDLTEQEHVHASTLLGKLPDRIFGSAEEVVKDLRFL